MNVEKQDKSGLVYILTNPVMPGIVRIGKTKRPEDMIEKRIKELDNTAVPMPFEPFFFPFSMLCNFLLKSKKLCIQLKELI